MKMIKHAFVAFLFIIISVSLVQAQLFTPGGTIRNNTTNNSIGIGITPSGSYPFDVYGSQRIFTHGSNNSNVMLAVENYGAGTGQDQGYSRLMVQRANGADINLLATGNAAYNGIPQQSAAIFTRWARPIIFAVSLGNGSSSSPIAERMRITSDGKVGIGTTNFGGDFKLYVNGGIRGRHCKVDLQTDWGDYVFETTYKLPTLNEVEAYIKANKHLPGVPSAAKLAKDGLDLGEMQKTQMVKIEELTLYTIQLKKEISEKNKSIEKLTKDNADKDKVISQILKRLEALEQKNK